MAKKHTTPPDEFDGIAPTPDVPETPAPEPTPEPTAPAIVLESWESEDIQALQLNWTPKSETREIGVPLTREEIQDFASKLADTVERIKELEAEKKTASDALNAQIKEQEKAQRHLSNAIKRGNDLRDVPCLWLFEIAGRTDTGKFVRDSNFKTIVRQDTGAVIQVLPITRDDRQMGLPLGEEDQAALDQTKDALFEKIDEILQSPDEEFSIDANAENIAHIHATEPVDDDRVTQVMLEACYDCGYSAFKQGETLEGNPYPTGTKQHTSWANGFKDSKEDAA